MNKGADIDIISRRPLEVKQQEKEQADEAKLRARAQDFGLTSSADGKKIIELVQMYLTRRIEHLMETDEQAKAYMTILNDLGIKESQARKAVLKLTNRAIKQE